jgi:hypothetical protein
MTGTLRAALQAFREGRESEAEAMRGQLAELELVRLELALAHRRGDGARAVELAARLWYAVEVDATVLAVLVHHRHPELRDVAAELMQRCASDAAYDLTAAWKQLAEAPGDLDAWRDVICSLVATDRAIEAIDGVARALAERHAEFGLWSTLVITLMAHRRRGALLLAIELARRAFPNAPEAHATCATIYIGLGDLDAADAELAAIGPRSHELPIVAAARAAMAEARAPAGAIQP